jgi:DNA-binding NarL/FixJ family response regulator
MAIKVVIYDDNKSRRDSLGLLILSDSSLELGGTFANCTSVISDMKQYQPDVVLMDIQMPEVDGIEAVRQIHESFPEIKVIMQTVFEDDDKVFESLQNGASGYILKRTPPEKVIEAVHDVYEGGSPITPAIASKVLKFFLSSQKPAKPFEQDFNLSERETEILIHLSQGFSYKLIAEKCSISVFTVNAHIRKIYQKLQVHSATEAIAKSGIRGTSLK